MSPHNDAPSPNGCYNTSSFNSLNVLDDFSINTDSSSPSSSNDAEADNYGSDRSQSIESCTNSSASTQTRTFTAPHLRARPLVPGVYVPTVCFFDPITEDLDTATIAAHAIRLARAGITGLTTQGSNGEAVHLTHAERSTVTSVTRTALTSAGFHHVPILVGCGAQSVRETVELCREAHAAGGDYALVLPPSYYAGLFAPAMGSVTDFFTSVADASPIPILVYNYPGAVSGMDLSSDIIVQLAAHANIAGVKLTCGNTGKLNRIAAATRAVKSPAGQNGNSVAPPFLVLGGSADFTLQGLVAGGHGILAGLANVAPKACLEVMRLYSAGKMEGAQRAQEIVSRGDWAVIQGGIVGTKSGLESWFGYGGFARRPLPRPTGKEGERWKELLREVVGFEGSL